MSREDWTTRPILPSDRSAWSQLYRGYSEFYGVELAPDQLDRVWSWIFDSQKIHCFVVVDASGEGPAIGFAHLRPVVNALRGRIDGYLDDLFVEPAQRGTGAVQALFEAIDAYAAEQGWHEVSWITAEDNHRAQGVYDKVASRTSWVTYEMDVRTRK
jgi:ribosomal protein S18 acetylase RimI-like enzyme